MKERVLTLALAVGAFALFYALLSPKPSGPQERPTRPVSTEQGPNGYLAMLRWLQAEGIGTVSLRDRYGELRAKSGDGNGHLLIATTPQLYPVRDSEARALGEWIDAGNTLLVLAGLSDTPDWSMGEGIDGEFMAHMKVMTGLSFVQAWDETEPDAAAGSVSNNPGSNDPGSNDPAANDPGAKKKHRPTLQETIAAQTKLTQPQHFEWVPNGPHPLLDGVRSVQAQSDFPSATWRAFSDSSDLVLELGQEKDSGEPALWLLRRGDGQIIVSAYGSVLTNKLLGTQDNARLLANIVNRSLAPGGKVIIDDAHQGLVAYYDPAAFFGDKRLHASLWWLAALWLVFVLGPQRLRASEAGWHPVDITSFVRASGGFLARVLKPAAAGERLFANFFNDIRRHTGLPANGAPLWDWISARGTVAAADVEQLQELHGKASRGQRIDVAKLQNLLIEVRHSLL